VKIAERATGPPVPEKSIYRDDNGGVITEVDPAMMNPTTIQPSFKSIDAIVGEGIAVIVASLCVASICVCLYLKFFHRVKSAAHEQTVAQEEREAFVTSNDNNIHGGGVSSEDGFQDEVEENLIGPTTSRWASKVEQKNT